VERIEGVLTRYRADHGIQTHALRTRQAGQRRFVSLHVLVPGQWSVQQGHHLLEKLELELHGILPDATLFTHLEPIDDPTSWEDIALDRPVATRRSGDSPSSQPPLQSSAVRSSPTARFAIR
jgi:hypothetical protein